jgi:hypothetical protein
VLLLWPLLLRDDDIVELIFALFRVEFIVVVVVEVRLCSNNVANDGLLLFVVVEPVAASTIAPRLVRLRPFVGVGVSRDVIVVVGGGLVEVDDDDNEPASSANAPFDGRDDNDDDVDDNDGVARLVSEEEDVVTVDVTVDIEKLVDDLVASVNDVVVEFEVLESVSVSLLGGDDDDDAAADVGLGKCSSALKDCELNGCSAFVGAARPQNNGDRL